MNIHCAIVESMREMGIKQPDQIVDFCKLVEEKFTPTDIDMVPCPQHDAVDAGCPLHAHVWFCGVKPCMIIKEKE